MSSLFDDRDLLAGAVAEPGQGQGAPPKLEVEKGGAAAAKSCGSSGSRRNKKKDKAGKRGFPASGAGAASLGLGRRKMTYAKVRARFPLLAEALTAAGELARLPALVHRKTLESLGEAATARRLEDRLMKAGITKMKAVLRRSKVDRVLFRELTKTVEKL
ncbi:hypothetical protein ABZP36_034507 [Zizania latifolia]